MKVGGLQGFCNPAGDAENTEFAKELRDMTKAAIESGIKEMQAKQAEAGPCHLVCIPSREKGDSLWARGKHWKNSGTICLKLETIGLIGFRRRLAFNTSI